MSSPAMGDDWGASGDSSLLPNHQRSLHKAKPLKKFCFLQTLGEGTYGKVKLAVDRKTGVKYAVKMIRKSAINTEVDLIRICREIDIMAMLRHPHIIQVYEVYESTKKIVLVMEYASGGELYEHISRKQGLCDDEARHFFRQIVSAVAYMHLNGFVHRDLKLENVLLDENNNIKIVDFGLANTHNGGRLLNTFCGSPLYASPEIVNGVPYHGPEVDCWSLGVLLYSMVYGAMPFDGSDFRRLRHQITEGIFREPTKRSNASGLIRHLLTPNPVLRATIFDAQFHWWTNLGYVNHTLNHHPQATPFVDNAAAFFDSSSRLAYESVVEMTSTNHLITDRNGGIETGISIPWYELTPALPVPSFDTTCAKSGIILAEASSLRGEGFKANKENVRQGKPSALSSSSGAKKPKRGILKNKRNSALVDSGCVINEHLICDIIGTAEAEKIGGGGMAEKIGGGGMAEKIGAGMAEAEKSGGRTEKDKECAASSESEPNRRHSWWELLKDGTEASDFSQPRSADAAGAPAFVQPRSTVSVAAEFSQPKPDFSSPAAASEASSDRRKPTKIKGILKRHRHSSGEEAASAAWKHEATDTDNNVVDPTWRYSLGSHCSETSSADDPALNFSFDSMDSEGYMARFLLGSGEHCLPLCSVNIDLGGSGTSAGNMGGDDDGVAGEGEAMGTLPPPLPKTPPPPYHGSCSSAKRMFLFEQMFTASEEEVGENCPGQWESGTRKVEAEIRSPDEWDSFESIGEGKERICKNGTSELEDLVDFVGEIETGTRLDEKSNTLDIIRDERREEEERARKRDYEEFVLDFTEAPYAYTDDDFFSKDRTYDDDFFDKDVDDSSNNCPEILSPVLLDEPASRDKFTTADGEQESRYKTDDDFENNNVYDDDKVDVTSRGSDFLGINDTVYRPILSCDDISRLTNTLDDITSKIESFDIASTILALDEMEKIWLCDDDNHILTDV